VLADALCSLTRWCVVLSVKQTVVIHSLGELQDIVPYVHPDTSTTVMRTDNVVLIGSKIFIPVNHDDREIPQMRGELHIEAMTAALENFTGQKLNKGLLMLEEDRKGARIFHHLKEIPTELTYISNDERIVLRKSSSLVFEFSFHPIREIPILTPKSERIINVLSTFNAAKPKKLEFEENNPSNVNIRIQQSRRAVKSQQQISAHASPGPLASAHNIPPHTPRTSKLLIDQDSPLTPSHANASTFFPTKPEQNLIQIDSPVRVPLLPPPPSPAPRAALIQIESPLSAPPPPPAPAPPAPPAPPPPPGFGFDSPIAPPLPGFAPSKKQTRKLKPLHWNAIPANQLAKTVFSELSPVHLNEDAEKNLENLFATSPQGNNAVKAAATPLQKKKTGAAVLDIRKSNNAAIVLAQFKLSIKDIKQAVETLDDSVLSTDQLIALKSLFPLSKVEQQALASFENREHELPNAERFYIEALKMTHFEQRIECFLYHKQFAGCFDDLFEQVNTISRAVAQMRDSNNIKQLLKLILAVGQVLNRGTYLAARGFKLSSLIRIAETKARNQTTTLLDCVISTAAAQQQQHLFTLFDELPDISAASRLDLESTVADLADLKAGLATLERELLFFSSAGAATLFCDVMTPFQAEASQKLQQLEQLIHDTKANFDQVCIYFGEEPKEQSATTLFGPLVAFSNTYRNAVAAFKKK
jgi:hypothetical protein